MFKLIRISKCTKHWFFEGLFVSQSLWCAPTKIFFKDLRLLSGKPGVLFMPDPPQASPSPTCPLSGHQMQSLSLGPPFNLLSLLPFPGKKTLSLNLLLGYHLIKLVLICQVFERLEIFFFFFELRLFWCIFSKYRDWVIVGSKILLPSSPVAVLAPPPYHVCVACPWWMTYKAFLASVPTSRLLVKSWWRLSPRWKRWALNIFLFWN